MKRIENEIKSKMVFLTGNGDIYKIGDFVEEDGMIYSNHSYQRYTFLPYHYHYSWDSYADYYSSAMLCPSEVLPTPGGPARQMMEPSISPLSLETPMNSRMRFLTSSRP